MELPDFIMGLSALAVDSNENADTELAKFHPSSEVSENLPVRSSRLAKARQWTKISTCPFHLSWICLTMFSISPGFCTSSSMKSVGASGSVSWRTLPSIFSLIGKYVTPISAPACLRDCAMPQAIDLLLAMPVTSAFFPRRSTSGVVAILSSSSCILSLDTEDDARDLFAANARCVLATHDLFAATRERSMAPVWTTNADWLMLLLLLLFLFLLLVGFQFLRRYS
mmetsp:Transcript_2654/g.4631  ORF Transcript_2654/g.4631 Transcript_2654/m.4631 type:complete len:225 (-) Transcript_2654:25-699(-)